MKKYLILSLLALSACGESTQSATVRQYQDMRAREIAAEQAKPASPPSEAAARCYNDPECSYWAAKSSYVYVPPMGTVTIVDVPTYRWQEPIFAKHGQIVQTTTPMAVGRP